MNLYISLGLITEGDKTQCIFFFVQKVRHRKNRNAKDYLD